MFYFTCNHGLNHLNSVHMQLMTFPIS